MPIRVLIVDDSALIRQLLSEILGRDREIEIAGTAADPYQAREKIRSLNPDVITLDIEMPRMDGLSFLEKLMALRPTPVVVVSTLSQRGGDVALRALELGAVECVGKPLADIRTGMNALAEELVAKVKLAARTRLRARAMKEAARPRLKLDPRLSATGRIVAIGASTGGVEALQTICAALPAGGPAILIAQHMPPAFTASFARRLDEKCAMNVVEATEGRPVTPGTIIIADGNRHLQLARSGGHFHCHLSDAPRVNGHKPSVDVLFESVAEQAGANALGVILTGMGNDGARGLLRMREAGAPTIGQDEATCLIYGMPMAAQRMGAVVRELPLGGIAAAITEG